MVRLFEVEIANSMDDHCRVRILACSNKDINAINNASFLAEHFIELNNYSGEYITRVREVKPIDISTEGSFSDIIRPIFKE